MEEVDGMGSDSDSVDDKPSSRRNGLEAVLRKASRRHFNEDQGTARVPLVNLSSNGSRMQAKQPQSSN